MGLNRKVIIALLIFFAPVQLSAGEFLNSVVHLNFGFMYGFSFGDIIDREHDDYYIEKDGRKFRPSHYCTAFGLTVDIVPFPPVLLGSESHAVKFGVRGGYRFHSIQQKISVELSDRTEQDYKGELLNYQTWFVGPVVHYAPWIGPSDMDGNYTSGVGFTFYVLYGQLLSGKLSAYPSLRDYGSPPAGNSNSDFTGYRIDAGFGAEVTFCSINIGLNIYYSMIKTDLSTPVDGYSSLSATPAFHEVCFEIFMGIPIEWLKFPKVF